MSALIEIKVNNYLENRIIDRLLDDEEHMESIMERNYDDDDKLTDAFIDKSFNNWIDGYDIADDEIYTKFFENHRFLIKAINLIGKCRKDYGDDIDCSNINFQQIVREYAYFWSLNNYDVIKRKINERYSDEIILK